MTNQTPFHQRTLGVFSTSGLCNRLRVLTSRLTVAEATGRQFYMLWPRTEACGAFFHELFVNKWDVRPIDKSIDELNQMANVPYISNLNNKMPNLLVEDRANIIIGSSHTLLQPKHFPTHEAFVNRCIEVFDQLEIIPSVQNYIDRFRNEHFRSPMIGVHARRGDFTEFRPDVVDNTHALFHEVDRFLSLHPQAHIFLATDDGAPSPGSYTTVVEGVQSRFRTRYGERIACYQPRSLDRDRPESIQDALVDLWLLRSANYFVGTSGSTFSEMAVYGRDIPYVLCGTPQSWYQVTDQVSRVTGIQLLFNKFWYWRYGRAVSFRYVVVQTMMRLRKYMRRIVS